jgi:hypothetical protein
LADVKKVVVELVLEHLPGLAAKVFLPNQGPCGIERYLAREKDEALA